MRTGLINALIKLAAKNQNIMLLTADLGYGVFEDFSEKFPKQFLNVGIAEQNMIGIASGLALEGKIVFVYSIGNFPTLRCLEQIRNDACYHELNIKIIAMGAGFSYGALGMSHHATEDVGIMRSLPGITILSPATILEAELATIALAKHPGVGYLRIDKSKATLDNEEQNFEIGKCRVLANGHDYTIFVTGSIAEVAIAAANMLKTDGISLKVIGVPSIKPIDKKTILNEITNTKGILTLEEGNIINGLGSAISDIFSEAQVYPEKFKKFGISDIYVSIVGTQDYLREYCGLTVENISNQVKQWVIES